MKKIAFTFIVTTLLLGLSACGKNPLGASVEVKVVNLLNAPAKGKTVYLFKDVLTNNSKPGDAIKQVVTDDNGIALFRLNLAEFNIFESQTSLYFGVFYTVGDNNILAGSNAITVAHGDEKSIELKIPL